MLCTSSPNHVCDMGQRSCLTHKHVQCGGVIEELLRGVAGARGLRAAHPHGPDEVLIHQHRCQGDGLESRHSKAVGDEPVHQGRTCRKKGSSHTKTGCSSEERQMVSYHTGFHLLKRFSTIPKIVRETQSWPKAWSSKCASIHPKSKRKRCWRAWLQCQVPLGQSLSQYGGSTVSSSLVPAMWHIRCEWLFACSRCTCEGLFISVALIQIAGQLNSSTAVIHSLHYVAANKSIAQHQQMREIGRNSCMLLSVPGRSSWLST